MLPFSSRAYHAALSRMKLAKSKRSIARMLKQGGPIFLEVGSGAKHGTNGWVTVDMADGCDLYWDLRRGIPFPSATISKIYSSHFLEHLSYGEGQQFLTECRRVLAPGGLFQICVPNARLYMEAYLNRTSLDSKVWCTYKPAMNGTTAIDYVNYTAYMDGHHKYMFDPENLLHRLGSVGLRNPALRPFDDALDLIDRDFESIYAQAEK
jgi:predicted SAM-dependent methyltransferase